MPDLTAPAARAAVHDLEIHRSGVSHSEAAVTLDAQQALALPILSSCALLVLFFFFKAVQLLLLLVLLLAGAVAVVFVLQPLMDAAAAGRHVWLRRRVPLCGGLAPRADALLQGAAAAAVAVGWLVTGSMALNNLLGVCLCLTFASFVRLPNIKVRRQAAAARPFGSVVSLTPSRVHGGRPTLARLPAAQVCTLLLTALFFYDIFWVFLSERFFGQNVMVEAATKRADNPAFAAAQALRLPSGLVAPQLELPVKLLFPARIFTWSPQQPAMMLGLGDMALPATLLTLLLVHDVESWAAAHGGGGGALGMLRRWEFWGQSYALPSWAGYAVGMVAALGAGSVFQAAQPALLYLVPAALAPPAVLAASRGELRRLWEGQAGPPPREEKQVDV